MTSPQDLRNNISGLICLIALIINIIYLPIYMVNFLVWGATGGVAFEGLIIASFPVYFFFLDSRTIFRSISIQGEVYFKKGQKAPIRGMIIFTGIYNLIIGIFFFEFTGIILILSAIGTIIAGVIYQKYTMKYTIGELIPSILTIKFEEEGLIFISKKESFKISKKAIVDILEKQKSYPYINVNCTNH